GRPEAPGRRLPPRQGEPVALGSETARTTRRRPPRRRILRLGHPARARRVEDVKEPRGAPRYLLSGADPARRQGGEPQERAGEGGQAAGADAEGDGHADAHAAAAGAARDAAPGGT